MLPIHIVRTAHTTPARSVRRAHDAPWPFNDGKTWDPGTLTHAFPPGFHFINAFSVFTVQSTLRPFAFICGQSSPNETAAGSADRFQKTDAGR